MKNHTTQNLPDVSIIILNWNGWEDTIECLESLYQIIYPNYDVIVVDNGSEDESIEMIKEYAKGKMKVKSKFFEYDPDNKPIKIVEYTREEAEAGGGKEKEIVNISSNRKLIIIKNEKNYGFAEGNNIGMRYALTALNPGYVLLLNNDTVEDKEFLDELVKIAESDDKIGIVGPTVYYYNEQNRIQSAGAKMYWNTGKQNVLRSNKIDNGQFNELAEVDYVAGCALLAKSKLFEKIDYLNNKYFAYWEETDWCIRAHEAGYEVLCIPKAKIWHKRSSTAKKTSGFAEYLMVRNMFWFMKQHATRRQYLSFLLYFFGFQFWFTSGIHILYHKNKHAFISFLKGVRDGFKMSYR
jgi:GT2 family glycosyltransferase